MSDLISVLFEDLILRAGEDGDGKTLEGYIVPWDKPALVSKPVPGYEVYKRGALTRSIEESKAGIPLLGLHEESGPVGKLVRSVADETGQHATFRLFDTQAARDAAELVREGMWTGLSLGGYGVPARTKVTRGVDGKNVITRSEIRLDHVALVRKPAFDDAKVLALRQEDEGPSAAAIAAEARIRIRNRLLV